MNHNRRTFIRNSGAALLSGIIPAPFHACTDKKVPGLAVQLYTIRDQIAIAGIGTTGFSRSGNRSPLALALEAATRAIRDA